MPTDLQQQMMLARNAQHQGNEARRLQALQAAQNVEPRQGPGMPLGRRTLGPEAHQRFGTPGNPQTLGELVQGIQAGSVGQAQPAGPADSATGGRNDFLRVSADDLTAMPQFLNGSASKILTPVRSHFSQLSQALINASNSRPQGAFQAGGFDVNEASQELPGTVQQLLDQGYTEDEISNIFAAPALAIGGDVETTAARDPLEVARDRILAEGETDGRVAAALGAGLQDRRAAPNTVQEARDQGFTPEEIAAALGAGLR